MEEARKKYQGMMEKGAELETRIADLERRLPELFKAAEEADAEAYRAELLDEGGWKRLRAEADRQKGLAAAAREEVGRLRQGIGIMVEARTKAQPAVRAELQAAYKPKYASLMRDFDAVLERGLALAKKMDQLVREADLESAQLLGNAIGASILTPWGRAQLEVDFIDDALAAFRKLAKINGYEL